MTVALVQNADKGLASPIDPQHCAILCDPLPVEHVWAHWFIVNSHGSSHFSHLDRWELVKFFKVKSVLFLLLRDWSMICGYKGFVLNLAHLWFPFVMNGVRGGTSTRVFIRSHSQQLSCDLLCPPWPFIKNRSAAVEGSPAASRVWMESSGNTDTVRDSLISSAVCRPWEMEPWCSGAGSQWTVTTLEVSCSLFPKWNEMLPSETRDSFVYLWPDY